MKYKNVIEFQSSTKYDTRHVAQILTSGIRGIESLTFKVEPVKIIYPNTGAKSIRRVVVKLATVVSKDHAERIVRYWGQIPFVGEVSPMIDWFGGDMHIHVNVSKTTSKDVEKRKILELLAEFLENGTTVKKNGQRTYIGLGADSVLTVIGNIS